MFGILMTVAFGQHDIPISPQQSMEQVNNHRSTRHVIIVVPPHMYYLCLGKTKPTDCGFDIIRIALVMLDVFESNNFTMSKIYLSFCVFGIWN